MFLFSWGFRQKNKVVGFSIHKNEVFLLCLRQPTTGFCLEFLPVWFSFPEKPAALGFGWKVQDKNHFLQSLLLFSHFFLGLATTRFSRVVYSLGVSSSQQSQPKTWF